MTMPYQADLTKFYHPERNGIPSHTIVCVGWLDELHFFETGTVADEILDKILRLIQKPRYQTREYHPCPLCPKNLDIINSIFLCRGQIRVVGKNGKIYGAPTLIYHYIKAHNYRPPEEFLEAVAGLQL